MSLPALALPLLLLATPAQPSPEELWAVIVNPATPSAERARLVVQARDILPPEYIPRLVKARLARDYLHVPQPDMLAVLGGVEISPRNADGYTIVRDLPCQTYFDAHVIIESLRQFPMTAETYGVIRNAVLSREDEYLQRDLPQWWTYAGTDDWHAAQAFIVELSTVVEPEGATFITELIVTISRKIFDLGRMLAKMHPPGSDGPFPYTAFLAMADRIEREALHAENPCPPVYDAFHLLQITGDSPFPEQPQFHSAPSCTAGLERFRAWLKEHRDTLEAGSAMEAAAVAEARARMNRVSLCRE
ncbi:MAG TPA: hypothetical protein VF432_24590 [Thermoanaerobaculia bacterium]